MQLKKVKDLQPGDKVALFNLCTSDLEKAQLILAENAQGIADLVSEFGDQVVTEVRRRVDQRTMVHAGPNYRTGLRPEWYVVVSE